MFPFTGFGNGLASIAIHTVFFSMGIALPASLVVVIFSRKALAWMYLILYAITAGGIYLLHTANSGVPLLSFFSPKRAIGAMFRSDAVLYLILAILAAAVVRVERRKKVSFAKMSEKE